MTSRQSRVVRGLAAAAVATFFAAFSHGTADGQAPSVLALSVATVIAVAVCVTLAGRTNSLPRLAISVGVSQLAFHVLFALAPIAEGTVSTSAAHAGHASAVILQPDVSALAAHSHPAFSMWVAHALAAIVTIAMLWRGEVALVSLLDLLRLSVLALLAAAISPPVRSVTVKPDDRVRRAIGVDLLSLLRYRGPPRATAGFASAI